MVTVAVFASVLIISIIAQYIGWALIGLILISLFYLWVASIPTVIKELYRTITKPKRKDANNEKLDTKGKTAPKKSMKIRFQRKVKVDVKGLKNKRKDKNVKKRDLPVSEFTFNPKRQNCSAAEDN